MKRRFLLFLVICLFYTACAIDTTDSVSDQHTSAPVATATSNPAAAEPSPIPKPTATPELVTIEEQVVLNEKGLKITVKELTEGYSGPELKFLIENNTHQDLLISTANESVNGYMMYLSMYAEVGAGKKANETVIVFSNSLDRCGIDTIADLSFMIYADDIVSYNTYLESDQINLKTSAADSYEYSYDDTGMLLYEEKGIKIVMKGLTDYDPHMGQDILFYMYNSREESVRISSKNESVNGFMVDGSIYQELPPNKHAIAALTLWPGILEENDIDTIEDLELSFEIREAESYNMIDITDSFQLTF